MREENIAILGMIFNNSGSVLGVRLSVDNSTYDFVDDGVHFIGVDY